jgi:hypothetical protein
VPEAARIAQARERKRIGRKAVERRRSLLGAAANAAAEIFLNLDRETRARVFRAYRQAFGEKKAEYIRRVYEGCRSGQVGMSGEMRDRLLRFLPPILSFEAKCKSVITAAFSGREGGPG